MGNEETDFNYEQPWSRNCLAQPTTRTFMTATAKPKLMQPKNCRLYTTDKEQIRNKAMVGVSE